MSWLDAFKKIINTVQAGGMPAPQRPTINFTGGAVVTDNVANNSTDIAIVASAIAGQFGVALVNGLNSNVGYNNQPSARITGPSAAFSVGGLKPPSGTPAGGAVIDLLNTTSQPMTILNEDLSSTAAYRITVGVGVSSVIPPGFKVRVVYDGTTSRWVLVSGGQLYRIVTDPREYGAQCNGVADDTAALSAAIAATPQGGEVLIPPGVLLVSASLVITSSGVTFRGSGRKSIIRASGNTFHMFLLEADDLIFERFAVEGGTTVDSGSAGGVGQFAFFTNAAVYSPTRVKFDHVFISGPASSPQQGFNNGIKADSNCTDWTISKCRFEYLIGNNGAWGAGYGILLGQASFITVTGCRFFGNTASSPVQLRHAIYTSAGCSDCLYSNNLINATNEDSIPLNANYGRSPPNVRIQIVDNQITNRAAGFADSASISINGPATACVIQGNLIVSDGGVSISMTDGAQGGGNGGHRIDDNVIIDSGQTGISLQGVFNVYGRGNHVIDCSLSSTGTYPCLNVASTSTGQFNQQPTQVDVEVIAGTNRGWSVNVGIATPATVETWGQQFIVTEATNATPIVIGTPVAHGLSSGQPVIVTNVKGNTAANGKFSATVIDSTHFSLDGTAGNGTWTTSTGVVTTRVTNGLATNDPIQVTGVSPATTGVAGYALATVVDAFTVSLQGTAGGGSNALTVTSATNATPVKLGFGGAHGLATGQRVLVNGIGGNLSANGLFTVTVVDSTHVDLDGSIGTANYTSDGTVAVFADAIAPTHRCALQINSTGPQPSGVIPRVAGVPAYGLSYVQISGPVAPPGPIFAGVSNGNYQTYGLATSGDVNLSQYMSIRAKSALQSSDLNVCSLDGADDLTFGDYLNGLTTVLTSSTLVRIQCPSTVASFFSTLAQFNTDMQILSSSFSIGPTVAAPLWRVTEQGTDVAPPDWTIRGGAAMTGAVTHKDGGDLKLEGGPSAVGGSVGRINFSNAIVDSSASIGSGSALPGLPAGYMEVKVNGTIQKIPFYN